METGETVAVDRRRPVGWWLLLVLALSVGLSMLAGTRMVSRVGQSDEAVRTELRPIVDRYLALLASGDKEALAEWIDPSADPDWQAAILADPTAIAPPFVTSRLGQVGTLNENVDDVFQIEMLGTIEQDGVSVPAYAYVYFRRTADSWHPTLPLVDEHWGPAKQFDSGGVTLEYRVEESQEILTALTEVAALSRNLETVDPAATLPALTVVIDPVTPLSGIAVDAADGHATIHLRSPSVGWGAVEPTTHIRAQYAGAVLDLLPPAPDVHHRAGRVAVARYWVGQLNQAHPRFDTTLISTARPMVVEQRWPALVPVLTGQGDASETEVETALTTAYLWLLSEGLSVSDLQVLVTSHHDVNRVTQLITERLEQTPAEIEAAWQSAANVRYAPNG